MNEWTNEWMHKNFFGSLTNYFKGNEGARKSGRAVNCSPGNTEGECNLIGQEKKQQKV